MPKIQKSLSNDHKFYIMGAPIFSAESLKGEIDSVNSSVVDSLNNMRKLCHSFIDKHNNVHIYFNSISNLNQPNYKYISELYKS
jgi:hypothetical protein